MFKKTMKFDDLEGNEVTQTFYFNFNKKEVAELLEFGAIQKFADPSKEHLPLEEALAKLSTPREESGLSNTENNRQAYRIFQDLILDAYGVKGEDNVSFKKTEELRDYWESHVAYVELIFEFLADTKLAAEFIENCLPPKMVAQAKEELAAENKGKLSSETLSEMVQEAARRQENPETRIEPGVIDPDEKPEIVQAAKAIADGSVPEKKTKDLTVEDILEMDDVAFAKLDPQKLTKSQMLAAFRRKSQG